MKKKIINSGTIKYTYSELENLLSDKEKIISEKNNLLSDKENIISEKNNLLSDQENYILELSAKLNWYEEQLKLSKQRKFGSNSEKIDSEQLGLFDEAENTADGKVKEEALEEITYKRKKRKGKREEDFKDLPVEVIEYALSDEEKICPECENKLHEMKVEIRKELKLIPASVVIVEHRTHVYACRDCEKNNIKTPIIKAESPNPLIKNSFVSPSLGAYVFVRKYAESMPLDRQAKQFINIGIEFSKQTLSNWIIKLVALYLRFIYELLHEEIITQKVIHADETTLQVIKEDGRTANQKSYMWIFESGSCNDNQVVLYEYRTTRASKVPKNFLNGFDGFLHVDGYPGYHDIPNVQLVGCLVHAQRKFKDALDVIPKDKQKESKAYEGLQFFKRIFKLENKFKDYSEEERYEARLRESKPEMDALLLWLNKNSSQIKKSYLSQAINYTKNQWDKLTAFLLDGRLEASNNRAEQGIKHFVIGRKNWLFSFSSKGAESSAIAYSIIETAKANNLNPFLYLIFLFENMKDMDLNNKDEIKKLLPWNAPEECNLKISEK